MGPMLAPQQLGVPMSIRRNNSLLYGSGTKERKRISGDILPAVEARSLIRDEPIDQCAI